MEVMSRRETSFSSSLNPNAPLFVPRAYQAVEDFSDDWWELVQSSPWFRDYWLQECFQDPQNTLDHSHNDESALPDIEAVFDGYTDDDADKHEEEEEEEEQEKDEEEQERDYYRDLISLGALKWRKPRCALESPKYLQKAPKFVNLKVNPRPIQQPR